MSDDGAGAIRVGHAVAAILTDEAGRYLLQHRDDRPDVIFPGYWSCFGGGLEGGEAAVDGLVRELREELALDFDPAALAPVIATSFDYPGLAGAPLRREYFEARLEQCQIGRIRLGEGQGWGLFTPAQALEGVRITPYDGFALWIHRHHRRFQIV